MSRVLVTGGLGLVGRAVVARLLQQGYTVRILDRDDAAEVQKLDDADLFARCEYVQGDITEYDGLLEKMRSCDTVAHLAAIPNPVGAAPQEVFRVNAAGTFNVFQAAAVLGIRRISQASSINAIGLHYGVVPAEPFYFPIDEDHPPQGSDAYSFSKWVVEEIAEFFWRREGISSVSLRFTAVIPQRYAAWLGRRREMSAQMMAHLRTMTETEHRAWLEQVLDQVKTWRAQRKMEDPLFAQSMFGQNASASEEDRRVYMLSAMRNNFWTMIDDRDAAQAVEKGLSAQFEGAHRLFVNDQVNTMGVESEELLRYFFPDVTARKRPLHGSEALVSIERARRIIGFEPEFTLA